MADNVVPITPPYLTSLRDMDRELFFCERCLSRQFKLVRIRGQITVECSNCESAQTNLEVHDQDAD